MFVSVIVSQLVYSMTQLTTCVLGVTLHAQLALVLRMNSALSVMRDSFRLISTLVIQNATLKTHI